MNVGSLSIESIINADECISHLISRDKWDIRAAMVKISKYQNKILHILLNNNYIIPSFT